MTDSKRNTLIQAADVLSSTINNYLTKLYKNEKVEDEILYMGEFLVGSFLVNDEFYGNGFLDVIASTKFKREVFNRNGFNLETTNINVPENSLNLRQFLKQ